MVPLASVVEIRPYGGPLLVARYNGVTAAAINGGTLPGMSSGDMIPPRSVQEYPAMCRH